MESVSGTRTRRTDELAKLYRPTHVLPQEQILCVYKANDVVQIALVDRQPRKAGHRHRADDFVGRGVHIQSVDFDPRMHDVADGAVANAQGTPGEHLFRRVEHALVSARADQVLDVFDAQRFLVGDATTQAAEHEVRDCLRQPDEWPQNRMYGGNRPGKPLGNRLGIAPRKLPGDELADDEHGKR